MMQLRLGSGLRGNSDILDHAHLHVLPSRPLIRPFQPHSFFSPSRRGATSHSLARVPRPISLAMAYDMPSGACKDGESNLMRKLDQSLGDERASPENLDIALRSASALSAVLDKLAINNGVARISPI